VPHERLIVEDEHRGQCGCSGIWLHDVAHVR
jgi:hypothetical protein